MTIVEQLSLGRVCQEEGERNGVASWVTERHRSCPASPLSYDLHHKAITGLNTFKCLDISPFHVQMLYTVSTNSPLLVYILILKHNSISALHKYYIILNAFQNSCGDLLNSIDYKRFLYLWRQYFQSTDTSDVGNYLFHICKMGTILQSCFRTCNTNGSYCNIISSYS
uniref:Ovule protein n=1 Tax=Heterorhabditis bacteriophora TaxID=37862 RepID=A0A1I7XD29_HETBA